MRLAFKLETALFEQLDSFNQNPIKNYKNTKNTK